MKLPHGNIAAKTDEQSTDITVRELLEAVLADMKMGRQVMPCIIRMALSKLDVE